MSSDGFSLPTGSPTRPRSTDRAARRFVRRRRLDSADSRVGPGKANRLDAGRAQRRHEPRIHEAGEHADDDLERRLVGDAQPVDLALLDADPRERRIDLASAAMHDDQRDERLLSRQLRDRRREGGDALRILEQLSAEFQDDRSSYRQAATRPLVVAQHHVQVLDGLAGRALHEVVDDRTQAGCGRRQRRRASRCRRNSYTPRA